MNPTSSLKPKDNRWTGHIIATSKKPVYHLHNVAKILWYQKANGRALSLGTGAGADVVELIKLGWTVLSIDIEKISEKVVKGKLKGDVELDRFAFRHESIAEIKLTNTYDYVTSFNTLPFIDKENLPHVIREVSSHLKNKGVFAFNIFGTNHSFTKTKGVFGMTESDIKTILKNNRLDIKYIECIEHDNRQDGTHWNTIDVIAVKQ
jgi:cyclopropane fatty-acyl-phospholipid synthase-like methyltransferase